MAKSNSTAAAVNAAQTDLQDARQRVNVARVDLKRKRDALANAVLAFHGFRAKRTTADLVRENSAREIERRRAIVRGELPPEVQEPYRSPSHIDAVLRNGRGGSADFGYARPRAALRGPKLPSQR